MEGNGRRRERCAIYTRQSGVGRGTAPTSCAIQYEQCVELVRARGWEPTFERFDDWGLSGATLDRPALKRLTRRIEEGAIDRVVIWRLDRLSRTMRDWIEFDDMLRARGIGLTVGDGMIDRTGSTLGAFQMNMIASFAQFEREMIVDRIRDGRAARSGRGERTGGRTPFGYEADKRTKQLIIDRVDASLVRWMFEQAAAGVSPKAIAEDARTRSSRAWNARGVLFVLRNPAYVGRLVDGRPGVHPPIVALHVFEGVQAAIQARRTRAPSTREQAPAIDPFLLRGVLACAKCGHAMTTSTARKVEAPSRRSDVRTRRYYRCRQLGCGGEHFVAAQIERRFTDLLLSRARHLAARTRETVHALGEIWDYLIPLNQQRAVRAKFERIVWHESNRTLRVTLRESRSEHEPARDRAADSATGAGVETCSLAIHEGSR